MRKLSNRVLGVLSAAAICVSLGAGVPRVLEGKAESAKTSTRALILSRK